MLGAFPTHSIQPLNYVWTNPDSHQFRAAEVNSQINA